MKYTIQWSSNARDTLAELWLEFPTFRSEITQAAAAIDQLLQVDPGDHGESRDDGRRIVFAPPLAVTYRVDNSRGTVKILAVINLKRRTGE